MLARLSLLLMMVCAGTVFAACEAELRQLDRGLPDGMPAGSRAAQLFYGAVELVEPVLPAWRHNGTVPLDSSEAGYGAVGYLVGRDLLPDDWQQDSLEPGVWQAMLRRFINWYELDAAAAGLSELDGTDPVADLAEVLGAVSAAVRPVAIIAHDDAQEVAFVGILWNWSSYPRLLVRRLEPGTSVRSGVAGLLAELGTCAVDVERYALAPVATAWRLFVGTGDSTMFVLATEPARPRLPLVVEQDDVRDYLEFRAGEVAGTGQFSAAFSGQEIGFGAILGMITQIRTNVSPLRINHYLQVPRH